MNDYVLDKDAVGMLCYPSFTLFAVVRVTVFDVFAVLFLLAGSCLSWKPSIPSCLGMDMTTYEGLGSMGGDEF